MLKLKYILWMLGAWFCVSCSTTGNVTMSNPSPMINYMEESSAETLKIVSKQYREVARDYKKKTPPPGFCADYAILLFRNGKKKDAAAQLDAEKEYYPESEMYIETLRQQLFGADEKKQ